MGESVKKGKSTQVGTVSIRKNGRYYYARYRPEKGGKQVEKSLEVTNIHAARVKASKISALLEEGRFEEVEEAQKGRKMTFGQMLDVFDENYSRWSETTRKGNEGRISILRETFGHLALTAINRRKLEGWLRQRVDGGEITASTANRYLSILRPVFQMAVDYGYLLSSPALGVKRWRENQEIPEALTEEQAEALVALAPDYARPIFIMALDTGLRKSELWRLTWDDVLWEEQALRVRPVQSHKTSDGRKLYMTQRVQRLLQELSQNKTGPNILQAMDLKKLLHRLGRDIGVPGLHFHQMRHTCATLLLDRGVPLEKIQSWMGHRSILTTRRYAKTRPEGLKEAAAALEKR